MCVCVSASQKPHAIIDTQRIIRSVCNDWRFPTIWIILHTELCVMVSINTRCFSVSFGLFCFVFRLVEFRSISSVYSFLFDFDSPILLQEFLSFVESIRSIIPVSLNSFGDSSLFHLFPVTICGIASAFDENRFHFPVEEENRAYPRGRFVFLQFTSGHFRLDANYKIVLPINLTRKLTKHSKDW